MSWFTTADLAALLPVIALAGGALMVLVVGACARTAEGRSSLVYLAIASILAAAAGVAGAWAESAVLGAGAIHVGGFSAFLALVILAAGAVTALYSAGYIEALQIPATEYYGLLLFALSGMVYLVSANDLITIFISFELMSLCVYGLAAIHRRGRLGYEGAMKYFVLGAFASAFLLYGMALLYGASGTIYLDQLGGLSAGATRLTLAALGLLLTGFAFKIGAVPFHSWIPDAYQGAPAAVTGFMAVAVKAAGFGVLIRVFAACGFLGPDAPVGDDVVIGVIWGLAFVTMLLGNLIALAQDDLKRLLAYSGIAHSGYILVGVAAATRVSGAHSGLTAALFYLAAYAAMTLGVFAVLTTLRQGGQDIRRVSDLSGLARRRPGAALCLTICFLSLVGMPPTAGFVGKLWLFRAAIEAGLIGLVIVACLATAISIYFYLRPVVLMYTAKEADIELAKTPLSGQVAMVATVLCTLALGLLPSSAFEMAAAGVRSLLGG